MPKPKDIIELRDQLLDAFDLVKTDPRRVNQVKEMTNAAVMLNIDSGGVITNWPKYPNVAAFFPREEER